MILADTSAWIELLRKTGSVTAQAMRRRLDADEVATTDIVMSEVLAGANGAGHLVACGRALDASAFLAREPVEDAVEAARIFRACRQSGQSPRQLSNCLLAAVAIRHGIPVLHDDRDYDVIARYTDLKATRG